MPERFLTEIILNVLIPVDEHYVMKVQEEVSKMTGIDILGIEFRYIPSLGEKIHTPRDTSE